MIQKRRVKPKNDPRTFEYELDDGSLFPPKLIKGVEVQIHGRSGRYRFQYATETSAGKTVLTFVGGPLHGQLDEFVSAYPHKVGRVYTVNKTLINIQKGNNT